MEMDLKLELRSEMTTTQLREMGERQTAHQWRLAGSAQEEAHPQLTLAPSEQMDLFKMMQQTLRLE